MAEVYELNFNVPGGMPSGTVSAPGVGSGDREESTMRNYQKLLKDNTSGFWKKIGIDLTLRSMLKQSQLFTSIFGSFFQIVGAAIDVILTPFMPIIIPVIKKLASWIPDIKQSAEDIFRWGTNILRTIWTPIKATFDNIGNLLPQSVKDLFSAFFSSHHWKGLMVAMVALVSTTAGRGLLAKGFRGARSEVGMARAFGMDHVAMRGGQIAGGGRRGAGMFRPRGWGSMGNMHRGVGMAGGLFAAGSALGGMRDGGNTGASTALRIGAGAAGIGGMFFGPAGMAVGGVIALALNSWANKIQASERLKEQQTQADPTKGLLASNIEFHVAGNNPESIEYQRGVQQVVPIGGGGDISTMGTSV